MTKREIINDIMEINLSATPGFLSRFSDNELTDYLQHLQVVKQPQMIFDEDFQAQGVAVCEPPVAVLSQERELGRWDEYLDRTEAETQNQGDESKDIPAPRETADCIPAQSEGEGQAWLFWFCRIWCGFYGSLKIFWNYLESGGRVLEGFASFFYLFCETALTTPRENIYFILHLAGGDFELSVKWDRSSIG